MKNRNFRKNTAENPESQQEKKRDRLTTLNVSTRQKNGAFCSIIIFGGFQQ